MFVAVEKNCSLEIILNVNKKHNASEIVNGFNDSEGLKIWKDITIRSNFSGQGNLSFFRRCLGNQTTGYWAIDGIHYCKDNIGNSLRKHHSGKLDFRVIFRKFLDNSTLSQYKSTRM
jgi:hypothetical protein